MTSPLARLVRLVGQPLARQSAIQPADAIAILGCPTSRDGSLSELLAERVTAGMELYRLGLAPVVCVSGGGPRGRVEADAMAGAVRAAGIGSEALRVDREARSTRGNAIGVAQLLWPGAQVWLVTQPFHLRRAAHEFRRAGLRPLSWRIKDGLQDRAPGRAARWIVREYAAWGRAWFRR